MSLPARSLSQLCCLSYKLDNLSLNLWSCGFHRFGLLFFFWFLVHSLMLMRAETQTCSFIHACTRWFNPVTPSEGGGLQKFKQFLSSLLWECLDSDESLALALGSPWVVNLPGPRSLHMRGFLRNQLFSVTWGGMPDLLLFSLFFSLDWLTVWHSGQQTSYVNVSEVAGMC